MKRKIVATILLLIVALFIMWYGYKEHIKHEKDIWPQKEMLQ